MYVVNEIDLTRSLVRPELADPHSDPTHQSMQPTTLNWTRLLSVWRVYLSFDNSLKMSLGKRRGIEATKAPSGVINWQQSISPLRLLKVCAQVVSWPASSRSVVRSLGWTAPPTQRNKATLAEQNERRKKRRQVFHQLLLLLLLLLANKRLAGNYILAFRRATRNGVRHYRVGKRATLVPSAAAASHRKLAQR